MSNRTAMVTGASSGIGEAFVRELAKDGYAVTLVARNEHKLRELAKELGEKHRVLPADLGDRGQLQKIVDDLERTRYALLVNNAGYGIYGRFDEISVEQQEHMMSVNMNALVRLSHAFLKNACSGDALINVSSVLSWLSYPGGAVYAATKGFVTIFTESLWYEYKRKGVYVMALIPGATETGFLSVATRGRIRKEPGGPSYPPGVVVGDALAALKARKKPFVITGPLYRLLAFLATKFSGRKMMIEIMGKASTGLKS